MIDASSSGGIGGEGRKPLTAAAVAAIVGGDVRGDGMVELHGVAPLDRAEPHELSFYANARYATWYAKTRAGAVIVSPQLVDAADTGTRVVVAKPVDAMVRLLSHFHRGEQRPEGVHPSAIVAPDVILGSGVTIEPFAVIGEGVTLGDRCWIGANVVIGAHSRLGNDVRIHATAVVYPRVEIGDRVVVHSGARIGREGFGFVPGDGTVHRIPHVGRCVLEQDVEIGANSCVDRGSLDDTIVGAGTKVDNLVHIAHNVRIGRMCFIVAQAGIAGSVRIGDGVQIGGQAGLSGHLTVGSRASLAAQAGLIGDLPAGETWSGYPARPHKEQMRTLAAVQRLARILRPLEELLKNRSTS